MMPGAVPLTGQRFSSEPLGVSWIHGSAAPESVTDPALQVHWYDSHTVILRQSKAIDYEAPFLFLLFGADRAMLLDTGATEDAASFPLRRVIDALIAQWLERHPRSGYELLVLHTHAHGDHVAGDRQFADRPATTLVRAEREAAWAFLGLSEHDADPAPLDLGQRQLLCLAAPGHDRSAVVFYDPWTGFLFTGDTVYPGRLYVDDWYEFSRSIDRLIAFCAGHPVTHVPGCHIEMTREPGVDYPVGTDFQPDQP
ncbi:MAG: MBL fold metallo-hydrolase, partial [Actinobacteria bacterium]|nr:MBL fold metallo-hydrolase [Actinomycetota bacterium]